MAGMRLFASGATRNLDKEKFDYEGFLSPLVIERYGEYMHRNRKLPDGSLRESDNWQLGIEKGAYMKSLWRHLLELWKAHRGYPVKEVIEDSLCAIIFNASGYLHEVLKNEKEITYATPLSSNPPLPAFKADPGDTTGIIRPDSNAF